MGRQPGEGKPGKSLQHRALDASRVAPQKPPMTPPDASALTTDGTVDAIPIRDRSFLDARIWRVVWSTVAPVGVSVALVFGLRLLFGEQLDANMQDWLAQARNGHIGLPVTIAVFIVSAFIGFPQFALIAACVLAFGPVAGFWYSWIATLVSGMMTFAMGRSLGAGALKRFYGIEGGRITDFIGKNAFLASFIVRLVPSGPFIIVNMAMGATKMRAVPYVLGLATGSIPKTALVTFAGGGIAAAMAGNFGLMAVAGVSVAALAVAMGVVAHRIRRAKFRTVNP